MELRHLEYFVAVAEEQHFTRAAERLSVSQSGLSASIRTLERELGAPLFIRSTRRVGLTEAGRALLGEAHRALSSVRAAKAAVAATQGLLRGTLAVGAEQCVAGAHVPRLLARFRQRHPHVEIRLRQAGSRPLLDDVDAGRLDLAFVVASGPPPPMVRLLPLAEEPMVLLCHRDHPFAAADSVRWDQLGDEAFVDFHATWGPRHLADQAFTSVGSTRRVTLEVNDVHSLLELVQERLGIAVVPQHFAEKPPAAGLSVLPLTGGPQPVCKTSVAVLVDQAASPAAHALMALLDTSPAPAT